MKAIIVGAGRGRRMMPETESYPKCMMDGLAGRRVLDWILDSLAHAGIDDVAFVGGYQIRKVQAAYPQLRFHYNVEWANNNVLESLFYAEPEMDGPLVVSYSDIIFRPNVAQRLMATQEADVTLVVDRDWLQQHERRGSKTLAEAEKVIVSNGRVAQIGRHLPVNQAHGEFIGLARFSEAAAYQMRERYRVLRPQHLDSPFHEAPNIRQAYLTDMLQELIELGLQVSAVDIWTDWAELETPQDLAWARQQLTKHGEHGLTKQFWAVRAEGFDRLEWVRRQGYLETFIAAGDFQPSDRVLDVGCGTGIVSRAVAPLVAQMVGVDISPDMLQRARETTLTNCIFEEGLAQSLEFPDNWFEKVTARMVFHHLIEDCEQAMRECYRVLKLGGRMVLSEGIPPHPSLRDWYTQMFALKEERLTFLEDDLVALMEAGGFVVERIIKHVSPQVSIGNWLRQSGLPQNRQDQIMQMHLELDEAGKQHYRMTITDDDVLCDFTFVIVVGRKVLSS